MPYLKYLDENKREVAIAPLDMAGIDFRVSAPRVPGAKFTFVNANTIVSGPLTSKGWKTVPVKYLGVCDEVDAAPFAIIPLRHTRYLMGLDSLAIEPGKITLDMTSVGPGDDGYEEPEPVPSDKSSAA